MFHTRPGSFTVCFLALTLLMSGCAASTGVQVQTSPLATATEAATPTQVSTAAALPTEAPTATQTAVPTLPGPVQLVILHTNDNWGETEPCG